MSGRPLRISERTEPVTEYLSVMVALVPSESASKQLLEHADGTEPLDEQHVTLCLADIEDTPVSRDLVTNIVGSISTLYAPMNGEVSGYGVFRNEQDALIALWSIPGINGLRQRVVTDLRDVGIPIRSDFSLTPHQTLAYADPADGISIPSQQGQRRVKSNFATLVLALGDEGAEQWVRFPLSGVRIEAGLRAQAAPARGGNPDNPGQFSSEDKGYRKKEKPKKAPKSKGGESPAEQQQKGQGEAQEPAGGSGGDSAGQDAQDSSGAAQQPQEGYTGVTYDSEATSFTPEQRKAHGDVYGHFLPEGRYAEGDPRNEPEFEQRMAEKTELTEKYVKVTKEDIENGATEGGQTISLHDEIFDPTSGKRDVYTPERLAVHQEIIAKLSETYASYPREGKAIVMAGPPGAGKSTFLENYGMDEFGIEVKGKDEPKEDPPAKNFVTLNPDDFKELLPIDASRYPGLEPNELAAMLHEESSHLSKFAVKHFMSQGYNVIIDVTLGNAAKAIRNYVEPYAEQGYDYQVALVDGTMNNSLNNAGLRWKKPDKETGVRTYSGRFLPMHLIESNAPTEGSGYRSKNAEQFTEFMEHDLVSRAIVYDPDTATVAEAKGEGGVRDWLNDKRPTEETEDESFEAAAKLVRRALSSILRVKEGARMKRFAKSAPPNGTEITQKIQSYDNGEIDLATLTDWLVNHNYAPGASPETEAGSAEWYEEVENGTTIPGTFGEVIDAVAFGLLSWEDYATINKAMADSAQR